MAYFDVMLHAPTREAFVAAMVQYGYATLAEDNVTLIPCAGGAIDEIGPIVKVTGYDPETGEPITETVDGWHVNLRAYGPLYAQLTQGLPQTDAEGNLLPLFERTHITSAVSSLSWTETNAPVPPGFAGSSETRLFDPAMVATPQRVWA